MKVFDRNLGRFGPKVIIEGGVGVFISGAGFEFNKLIVDDCFWHNGSFGIGVIQLNDMKDFGRVVEPQRKVSIGVINSMDLIDDGIGNELADHATCLGIWLQGVCR